MVIQNFSQNIIASSVFRVYIAAVFFGTLIFFVLNADLFTPLEMMFGTVIITIAFKGIANIMISLVILLFDLQETQDRETLKLAEDKLDLLIHKTKMAMVEKQSSNK